MESALTSFERVGGVLAGARRVAVLLDYDGTLTPIVPDPECAVLGDSVRALLRLLSARGPTGVISGRSLAKIRRLVAVDGLLYAGSHGLDIQGPDGLSFSAVGAEHEQLMSGLLVHLQQALAAAGVPGAAVEDNHVAVTVHVRHVAPERLPEVEAVVESALAGLPAGSVRRSTGKKTLELRADVPWDKGEAVRWLVGALGEGVVPLYIGDDRTDEDAFRATREAGGVAIVVEEDPASRETSAQFVLRDPTEVEAFLGMLLPHLPPTPPASPPPSSSPPSSSPPSSSPVAS